MELLTELRDGREKGWVSEEYYQEIRAEFLDELVTRTRPPVVQLALWGLGALIGVGMAAFMIEGNVPRTAWVGAIPFSVCTLAGWRLYRDYAQKRDLNGTDRITALEELARLELISTEEVAVLRARIESTLEE